MRYDEPRKELLQPRMRTYLAGGLCLQNQTEVVLEFTVTVSQGGQLTITVRD